MEIRWFIQVTGNNLDILKAANALGKTYYNMYMQSRMFFDEEDGSDSEAVGDFAVKTLAEAVGVIKVIHESCKHLKMELFGSMRRKSDSKWVGQLCLGLNHNETYELSPWAAKDLSVESGRLE